MKTWKLYYKNKLLTTTKNMKELNHHISLAYLLGAQPKDLTMEVYDLE
jgi:hypothetical protein